MDLEDLYSLLREAHVQAQGVVDTLRYPLLVLDPDLTVLSANPAFFRTFETTHDDTVGRPFYELGDGQWNIDDLRLVLEKVTPKSASVFDYEVEADFAHLGPRTMLISAQRLLHPNSGRRLLMLTIVDATERRRKERGKELLLGEVHHRMKNLLSVTQALARQTQVRGRTAEQYRDDFLSRFIALGRSLDVSTRHESADLADLAHAVLEPYLNGDAAISLSGSSSVALMPKQTVSLGMILQELATNAVKHGALSVPAGRIDIDWNVNKDQQGIPHVEVRWTESDGPETAPPAANGFGTRLIESTVRHELGGTVEPTFAPDGFRMTLNFPQA